MKNNVLKRIFLTGLIIIIIFLIGWFCSKKYYCQPLNQIEIHDTIRVENIRIEEKTKIQFVTTIDTFTVVERDTIKDTIYFQLPIEHKEYTDTIRTDTSEINLKIKYSGFKSNIDEVDISNHYWKNIPVNQKKLHIKPSFNIGLGVGYGLGIREGCLKPEPQVGIYGTIGFSIVKY